MTMETGQSIGGSSQKFGHGQISAKDSYEVEWWCTKDVKPSPENDEIYGAVTYDAEMDRLVESIKSRGLLEPIIVTTDGYILSGHRRHYAATHLGFEALPVRVIDAAREDIEADYHGLLTEFNHQRKKTAGVLLKEALARHANQDAKELLKNHYEDSIQVDAEYLKVAGSKEIRPISEKKRAFLNATKKVIASLKAFWPLSVRQVHYQLLNDPPLISQPKKSKKPPEHYRYRNNDTSYDALIELLKQGRYAGEIPMSSIDDATRPRFLNRGFMDVSQFIEQHLDRFLVGYHRDRQLDQARHIEVLGEKNTLIQICKPVCEEYYVPLTLGRGYASIPVWRDMAARFDASGKSRMTLVVLSDYDPEGFDLADDAIRSLKDLWGIPVDYHRVGVKSEQITELDLTSNFNPAKQSSSRLDSFVKRTGGEETWELESLPPDYLQKQLRSAIESNMDMDVYHQTIEDEQHDAEELADFRRQILRDLEF